MSPGSFSGWHHICFGISVALTITMQRISISFGRRPAFPGLLYRRRTGRLEFGHSPENLLPVRPARSVPAVPPDYRSVKRRVELGRRLPCPGQAAQQNHRARPEEGSSLHATVRRHPIHRRGPTGGPHAIAPPGLSPATGESPSAASRRVAADLPASRSAPALNARAWWQADGRLITYGLFPPRLLAVSSSSAPSDQEPVPA